MFRVLPLCILLIGLFCQHQHGVYSKGNIANAQRVGQKERKPDKVDTVKDILTVNVDIAYAPERSQIMPNDTAAGSNVTGRNTTGHVSRTVVSRRDQFSYGTRFSEVQRSHVKRMVPESRGKYLNNRTLDEHVTESRGLFPMSACQRMTHGCELGDGRACVYNCPVYYICSPSDTTIPLTAVCYGDNGQEDSDNTTVCIEPCRPSCMCVGLTVDYIHDSPGTARYVCDELACIDNSTNSIRYKRTNIKMPLNISYANYFSKNLKATFHEYLFNAKAGQRVLHLSNNDISILLKNVFSGLSSLSDLDLSNNDITILPANVFSGLSSLSGLDLSFNDIIILPDNVFSGLSSLSYIYLILNNIEKLPENVFSGLSSLSDLNLSNNEITILPANVFSGLSSLSRLDLSFNDITILSANVFSELSSLSDLHLMHNDIAMLHENVFNGLSSLFRLTLSDNNITILPDNVFSGLSSLVHLTLSNNNITILPENVFSGLSSLSDLDLSNNDITMLPGNVFSGQSSLSSLYLSNNNITILHENVFSGLSSLSSLYLSNNDITILPDHVFSGPSRLSTLDLSNNVISILPKNIFSGLSRLSYFNISNNDISTIPDNMLNNASYLSALDLSGNRLTFIPSGLFLKQMYLKLLNIIGNDIEVTEHIFQGLDKLNKLYTDTKFMCCVRPESVGEDNCAAKVTSDLSRCHHYSMGCAVSTTTDSISSCLTLISSDVLRMCLWLIGIAAVVGNLFVILYRLLFDHNNLTKSHAIFILHLSISDFLMGIYLLIIGSMDVKYHGAYAWNDQKWRGSLLCTSAGIISTISSEMSTLLILMVTIDRFIVIVLPLSRLFRQGITWKQANVVCVLFWIVSTTLALTPVVAMQSYFKGRFYSQSGVCLALPLSSNNSPGSEYSFAVFVGLNSVIFVIILMGQIGIFQSIRSSGKVASTQSRQREIAIARTLFLVVATDFCCWFPIGLMGVMSQYGVKIPDDVYAWVMVFVLPVNAAVNPLLYTGTTIWRNRRRNAPNATPMTPQVRTSSTTPSG